MQVRHIPTFAEIVRTVRSGFRTDIGCPFGERRWVGLENEYLMVNADGSPVRREVLDHLWQALISQGWEALTDELSDRVVAVKRNRDDLANLKSHHYDLITTDLGYSTLEIDLAPAPSIPVAQKYLSKLIGAVTSILSKHDTFLLGYGVQPVVSPGPTYIGQKSRYALMLDICQQENGLTTEERGVDLHTVDAACQTQVEVSATEAIPAVNALSATSGLRVALLANSPVWQNQIADYKAIRLMFVRWSWPSRKQQLGMPPRFQDIEHYLDYIFDFRSLMVKRNQRLYKINNNFAFRRFLTDEFGQMGVSLDGRETRLFGEIEDVKTQSGFAWFNTRLQLAYGTVEDRVSCQQPPTLISALRL